MGDYFDDDDLINDYMDEDIEPPEDYDDAFLEAELGATKNDDTNSKNDAPQEQPEPMQEEALPQETEMQVNHSNEEEISVPLTVTIQPTEKKPNVYSFERYQGDWRTQSSSSDTTNKKQYGGFGNASQWERAKAQLLQPKTIKASAPDAQLVELSNENLFHNPKYFIHKYSSSVSRKPIEGDESTSLTLGDGTRMYVRKTSTTQTANNNDDDKFLDGNILGVSMTELLRRSDAILLKAERQKVAATANRPSIIDDDDDDSQDEVQDNGDVVMEEAKSEEEEQEMVTEPATKTPSKKVRFKKETSHTTKHDPDSQLWVDKHAPSEFSHLLSDERTNREVLRALRAWDPYVFKKEAPRRPTFLQQKLQESEHVSSNKDNDKQQSKDIRPDESQRVILLSGPPGIGKTTLAHIIARHAGYRPMEVNASDERSSAILKDRVVRAMESSTLNLQRKNGKDDLIGRPNCIILDEVDGADAKGAIGALVEIIRAEIPPKGTKGSKSKPYLRRPIIFICNHKYSPALRPLLPFARQFDVSPPSPTRLLARLRAVLAEEKLSVFGGSSLLNQLMNGTGGDIRACLYALQFAAARAREVARKKEEMDSAITGTAPLVDISSSLKAALAGSGLKDERSDASAAITAVFRRKKEQRLGSTIIRRDGGKSQRVERILQLIESFGEDSKTLDCIFTNLMNVSYVDPTLDRCTLAHEWLSSTDLCRSTHFLPAAAAAIHLLCRVETKPKLTFTNRRMVDAKYQLEANDNLAEKFVEGLAPSARGGATKGTAAIETVPYSLWMLSAGDGSFSLRRGVSSMEILNKNERVAFDAHVSTLRSLGLTYVARDDASMRHFNDNKPVPMRLEPQIDRLIQFQDLSFPPGSRRKYVPHVLKELLAHGAAIQGMRDNDNKKAAQVSPDTSPQKTDKSTADSSGLEAFSGSNKTRTSPTSKQRLGTSDLAPPPAKRTKTASANFLGLGAAKAKAARNARKAALVGFDKSKRLKVSNSGSEIPFNQVVRFKYQKGFTQAVRTPCKIEDIV